MASLIDFALAHAATIFGVLIVTSILAEKGWQLATNSNRHWQSTITSIGSGVASLVARALVGKAIFIGLGMWIYHNYRLFDLDLTNPLVWVAVFVIQDFAYYWFHRLEHSTRFLWASHLVHHSSETISMATSVRVPWMGAIYKPFYSLWMPLLGFNPLAAIVLDVVVACASQWHHTEAFAANPTGLIGKVFVTPSAHRVHHGHNPEYIDKNFGALLIVWDRAFGTYEAEVAPATYGVGEVDAVRTVGDALVGGYGRLFSDMAGARSFDHAFDIAIARPGVNVPQPDPTPT